jgi:hypothetical protein
MSAIALNALGLTMLCSCATLLILALLIRRRPGIETAAA